MDTNSLIIWVQNSRKQGYSEDQIYNSMLQSGYNPEFTRYLLKEVRTRDATQNNLRRRSVPIKQNPKLKEIWRYLVPTERLVLICLIFGILGVVGLIILEGLKTLKAGEDTNMILLDIYVLAWMGGMGGLLSIRSRALNRMRRPGDDNSIVDKEIQDSDNAINSIMDFFKTYLKWSIASVLFSVVLLICICSAIVLIILFQ